MQEGLFELSIHVKGYEHQAPVISRLFFDAKSGGVSTIPVLAERGKDKDSQLAKDIAHHIKCEPFHKKD